MEIDEKYIKGTGAMEKARLELEQLQKEALQKQASQIRIERNKTPPYGLYYVLAFFAVFWGLKFLFASDCPDGTWKVICSNRPYSEQSNFERYLRP